MLAQLHASTQRLCDTQVKILEVLSGSSKLLQKRKKCACQ